MGEASAPLSSAVIVPDPIEGPVPSPTTSKRRQSSVSEHNAKRPRLSDRDSTTTDARSPPLADTTDERPGRFRRPVSSNNQLEERKRGQRLFGALLGTLSQSSSSSTAQAKAQSRRKDIEQKQSAKLKHEADVFDEKKRQRLEVLNNVRRREQRVYERQAMAVRHSNLLAQAHFLQTKAEPRLYYKPWELRESEKETIKSQIAEAEAIIEKERREAAEAKHEPLPEHKPNDTETKNVDMGEAPANGGDESHEERVGTNTNDVHANQDNEAGKLEGEKRKHEGTKGESASEAMDTNGTPTETIHEEAKDQGDDGGDLVEGDEDAVIY